MPSFILHLLHGEFILQLCKSKFSETEKHEFRMGLLMPDVNKVKKVHNDYSHFYLPAQEEKILQIPDLDKFPYRFFIDQPFILGYTAHLYLDKLFFEDYFQNFIQFLDHNGRATLEKSRIESVFLTRSEKYISVDELFSEKYLYGDYTMLNPYLIKKYNIKPVQKVCVHNPITEVRIEDFHVVTNALQNYFSDTSININMNVFSLESLETSIERYAFGFLQWSEGIRSALKLR